jgi:putative tryptophan/tyrosine transport system substrate-binding protein
VLKSQRINDAYLPVQGPTKFKMILNLRTAKSLGLTVPPPVLARADEVIGRVVR